MSVGRFAVAVLLAAALWSCADDERHFRSGVIDPEHTPTMTTLRANTIITDSGYPRYRIIAPTWLMFEEAEDPRWTFPDGMHMEQYDNAGNIHSTIDCDSATYFSARQTWRLDGAVDIAGAEGQRFLTQQLFWDRIHHEVYSDSFIHIERPDRVIEGFGFKSNDRMTRYVVLHPSGIFPASQFDRNNGDEEYFEPIHNTPDTAAINGPYDVEAAAADDPEDARRTDEAFNGDPTDTIYVSPDAVNRPQRRAARNVLRRRTPYSQQQQKTDSASAPAPAPDAATPPAPRLPVPTGPRSASSTKSVQQNSRQ